MFLLKRNIPTRQLYIKANSLGIPIEMTNPFLADVMKWEEKSGIDWTVQRLKSLKQDLINYYNSNSVPLTPWVKRNSKGLFKGYIGILFQYSLNSFKCFKKVLSLLNIYTIYTFEKPRPTKEISKFIQAVTTPGITPQKYLFLAVDSAKRFQENWKPISNEPFECCLTTSNREERFMREPRQFFKTSAGISTYIKFKEILDQSMTSFIRKGTASKMSLLMGGKDSEPPYIGEIHCTPNPGLKARFFASPHLWLQHALEPIGNMIYDKVKSLPWDCTFDQLKADHSIQSHLLAKSELYCFDLTSATDRFPFDLQLQTLRSIFTDSDARSHISFYEHMQSLPYKFNDSPLYWERGQALGMYPSFGTFTLCHGMMLFGLNNFKHDNKFFVLGDDVIILDKDLADQYSTFLLDCDIEFSPHKTIVSSTIAEFAGMLYSSNSKVRIPKWKPLMKSNCVEQIGQWGVNLIRLLPKGIQPLAIRVSALPHPYGCGYNPKGLSLDERFFGFEDIFSPVEKDLGFATNFKSMVAKRFFTSNDFLYENASFDAIHNACILDQRIQEYANKSVLGIPAAIAGKNLYTVDPGLGLPLALSIGKDRNPQDYWSSNLMRYKNLLKENKS